MTPSFSERICRPGGFDSCGRGRIPLDESQRRGQVRPVSNDEGGTGEGLVVVRSLPEAIRNALDGAKEGDFVFYSKGKVLHGAERRKTRSLKSATV